MKMRSTHLMNQDTDLTVASKVAITYRRQFWYCPIKALMCVRDREAREDIFFLNKS